MNTYVTVHWTQQLETTWNLFNYGTSFYIKKWIKSHFLGARCMSNHQCRDFPFASGSMDEKKEEIDKDLYWIESCWSCWPTLIARDRPTADFTEKTPAADNHR